MAPSDKAQVVRALREIALYLQVKGENAFKVRAYELGADRISGLQEDLATLVAENRLQALPGIGAALADKISELVLHGRLEYLEKLRAEFPLGILELLQVPDLGPRKAVALWKELGVTNLAELEAACRDTRVRHVKGFGEKTEEKILAGIGLLRRSGPARHRLGDVLPVAEALLAAVRGAPGVQRASLGGSVRRFCETVSDVDLIASAPSPEPVFDVLTGHPEVREVIARGDSKCSVRLSRHDLQVDLRVLPDEDFATALHHFTGSKAHHIRLRGLAQDRGLRISEWGVFRGTEKLPVRDEGELYALLDLAYVPPELREDAGDVEAAQARRLPEGLVTEADVLGNVHSHSTWSDGRDSLEAMALAARARGIQYLTVTEHSQTAGYAGGLTEDALQRQWDEIDALNARLEGIRLLKGIESDIKEDGTLDYPDHILEKLDVVIGSIHQRYGQSPEEMTERILRAFENPYLHIWGHPTGRLLLKRDPAGMDIEAILDRAAQRGITVEVNGNPERLDLKADHVRQALARGLKLVVSTDSHSVKELDHLRFAVGTARRGWARKEDVLNTLPVDGFLQALRAARR